MVLRIVLNEVEVPKSLHEYTDARPRRAYDCSQFFVISKGYYGLDQGPIVLMIENYRSGFLWRLMRRCPYIIDGLRRAGFSGGWLARA